MDTKRLSGIVTWCVASLIAMMMPVTTSAEPGGAAQHAGRLPLVARMNGTASFLASLAAIEAPTAVGAPTPPTAGARPTIHFTNVQVFDGTTPARKGPLNVLVRDGRIVAISADPLPSDGSEPHRTIDGTGQTLMPGLIDAHWHAMLVRPTPAAVIGSDIGYTTLVAAAEATDTLLRGFTTVRDMGGPVFGLKRAIDEGLVVGPRIFPCGAMITITGGHGDFRQTYELPRVPGDGLSRVEIVGGAMIADSPDEVRLRVREQLMLGASQIKLTAGGGVASPHSPLDVSTFTIEELRAAVEAAENWGTYVAVHAYTPEAIHRAVAAGVRCIEHGHLMDEATARLLAEKDIWLSTQPFMDDGGPGVFPPGSPQREKLEEVMAGTDHVYRLAREHGIRTAFGTDILFSPSQARAQNTQLLRLLRWYSPGEILVMATGTNGALLSMSGPRSPYDGAIGVIQEGALADLLLVDGDPLADLSIMADPAARFTVIMKDGCLYQDLTAR